MEAAPVVFLELVVAAGAIEFDVLLAGAAAGVDAGTADDLLLFIAPASDGAAADVPAEPGWPAVPASAFAFFLLLFLDAELSAGALAAPVELAAALPCMALVSDFLLFLEVFEGVLLAADSPADTADPVWSAVALDFLLFLEVLVEGSRSTGRSRLVARRGSTLFGFLGGFLGRSGGLVGGLVLRAALGLSPSGRDGQ